MVRFEIEMIYLWKFYSIVLIFNHHLQLMQCPTQSLSDTIISVPHCDKGKVTLKGLSTKAILSI